VHLLLKRDYQPDFHILEKESNVYGILQVYSVAILNLLKEQAL